MQGLVTALHAHNGMLLPDEMHRRVVLDELRRRIGCITYDDS